MSERADQLVLEYLGKAADAAHGVLRQEHRLDFVKRLRARIEAERHGSEDPKAVAKVLARFGDPAALVEREARRVSEGPVPKVRAEPEVRPVGDTAVLPRVPSAVPPGVAQSRRLAEARVARRREGGPFAALRRAAPATDARTIIEQHRREVSAMVVLVVAALLVPFDLPAIAIFRIPAIVWALGAVIVLMSETWELKDRVIGLGAPLFGYVAGGAAFGALRGGLGGFVQEFFAVSGLMFMIGAVLGVAWLGYRLLVVN